MQLDADACQMVLCQEVAEILSQIDSLATVKVTRSVLLVEKLGDEFVTDEGREVSVADGRVLLLRDEDLVLVLFGLTIFVLLFLELFEDVVLVKHASLFVCLSPLDPTIFIEALTIEEDKAKNSLVEVVVDSLRDLSQIEREDLVAHVGILLLFGKLSEPLHDFVFIFTREEVAVMLLASVH